MFALARSRRLLHLLLLRRRPAARGRRAATDGARQRPCSSSLALSSSLVGTGYLSCRGTRIRAVLNHQPPLPERLDHPHYRRRLLQLGRRHRRHRRSRREGRPALPRRSAVISIDGDIYPCQHQARDSKLTQEQSLTFTTAHLGEEIRRAWSLRLPSPRHGIRLRNNIGSFRDVRLSGRPSSSEQSFGPPVDTSSPRNDH